MSYISEEIIKVSKELGIIVKEMPSQEIEGLRNLMHDRFGLDLEHYSVYLTGYDETIWSNDAWSWISDFVGEDEVVLFFLKHVDSSAWIIPDGKSLVDILGECFGFVFFITSQKGEYLLAFDDNDCLIGTGTAAEWIRELRKKKRS